MCLFKCSTNHQPGLGMHWFFALTMSSSSLDPPPLPQDQGLARLCTVGQPEWWNHTAGRIKCLIAVRYIGGVSNVRYRSNVREPPLIPPLRSPCTLLSEGPENQTWLCPCRRLQLCYSLSILRAAAGIEPCTVWTKSTWIDICFLRGSEQLRGKIATQRP
jgi:hypothetical protein